MNQPVSSMKKVLFEHQNNKVKDNIYYQSKKIIVKMSCPEMGLGVFATEDIETKEIIERCPLIQLGWRQNYIGDPQIMRYSYPNTKCPCDECKKHGPSVFLPLGYGMLYNHQDDPNAIFHFDFSKLITDLIALKPITAGEEIFVSYGEKYFKNIPKHIINKLN